MLGACLTCWVLAFGRRPAFVDSLLRRAGGRGKAKQGRLQGKTNSAEPRESKPGSRAKSAGPKVGLRPTRWLGQQVWCSRPGGLRLFFPGKNDVSWKTCVDFDGFCNFYIILGILGAKWGPRAQMGPWALGPINKINMGLQGTK